MVWGLAAALLGGCLFILLASLVQARKKKLPAANPDIVFYHAQLDEISRQAEAGMIAPDEEKAAAAEAARRLLAASRVDDDRLRVAASPRSARIAIVFMLLAAPAIAIPIYARLGSPEQPAMPLAERTLPDPARVQIAAFIEQIETRLAGNPDDARGLELLAPLYLRVGRSEDAARAIARLIKVAGSSPERQADLGEALTAAHDGAVVPEARAAFEQAVAEKPSLQKAQFYLGRAYAQSGDTPRARAIFTALLSSVPENGPLHALINGEIAGLKDDAAGKGGKKETSP